ncbi:MAG TPA: hypothetical protein VKU37_02065 [Verrucomicrobiae bacterium]|nr:hypothetical protein [Verrucomicrobiae bacterium]
MKNKKLFFKTNGVGFVLGAALLTMLTANTGYADGLRVGIVVSPPVVVVTPPVVVVQDDYIYYPEYGVYYNSHRRQYANLENGVWVLQAAPQGVSVDVLLASPSVRMDFHDSPANHHAEMIRKYPKNWRPEGAHQDRKEDAKGPGPDHDRK